MKHDKKLEDFFKDCEKEVSKRFQSRRQDPIKGKNSNMGKRPVRRQK
jgi:hypothetical protein